MFAGYFPYILMIAFAIGMYWANTQYKTKGAPWGRPLAGLFGLLAILMALSKILHDSLGCERKSLQTDILEKELKYTEATYLYLGEYLAENHANSKVLLVANPKIARAGEYAKRRMEVIKDALEDGFDGRLSIVSTEHLEMPSMGKGGMPTMYESMFTAEAFDEIIDRNSQADLILSLVGLPIDWKDMEFWFKEEDRPKMVITNGQVYELKPPILDGYIHAVVYHNPSSGYDFKTPVPDDHKEAFDKRYLMIDAKNIESIAAKHSQMFMPDPK